MTNRTRTLRTPSRPSAAVAALLALAAAATFGAGVASAQGAPGGAQPVEIGEAFPGGVYRNLNGDAGPTSMDLAADLGKRPVVLLYWIPGNLRSEELVVDLQELLDEVGRDKIAAYTAYYPQPGRGADVARLRMQTIGVRLPVLEDASFEIGSRVGVRSVPHLSLIDAAGALRMTNAGSLRQSLEFNLDVGKAIGRAAAGKSVGTYGVLETYQPVVELVGKRCPDFQAPLLAAQGSAAGPSKSLHAMLAEDKVNVLIYWSVECGHCRTYLPEVTSWIKENPRDLNVLTAAAAPNEAVRIKTREFCSLKQIDFPTLLDEDASIGDLYKITSTPTVLLIGPDGVVQQVLHGGEDFGAAVDAARRRLL